MTDKTWKEIEEEEQERYSLVLEVANLREENNFLKNIIEDSLDADPADCWYVLKQGYKAHYEKFFGIKEDRIGKDPGRARAAKTARRK